MDYLSRAAEFKMAEVRRYLAIAYQFGRADPPDIETADAAIAVAANKLAQSIRLSSAVVGME